jgi:hypothetical protein
MPSSRKKKTPASGMTVPKAMNCQAEPEPIQPEEVLPPEENTQVLPPEEVLQTQELEQAVIPEGVQLSLNTEEWSEYASPSEETHPVTGKRKAALQSAPGRNFPSQENTPTRMTFHSHLQQDDGLWS